MQRRYVTVDVFTDRAFGGNQLAVVLDAQGLSTAQMQAIAVEFNYAETTFVLPPRDAANDAQVRIFTVTSELPFAGHPNVGTAFVLAKEAAKPPARLKFEEGAGLVPLEILTQGGKVVGAELTAPQPLKRMTEASAEQAAACISLSAADIRTDRQAPQIISVGMPFLVTELTSREALRKAKPNADAFARVFPVDGAFAIYFYTRDAAGRKALRSAGQNVLSGSEWPDRGPRHRECHRRACGAACRPRSRQRWRTAFAHRAGVRHGTSQRAAHARGQAGRQDHHRPCRRRLRDHDGGDFPFAGRGVTLVIAKQSGYPCASWPGLSRP